MPLVGKPVTGSFGANVALLHTREDLVAYCTKFDRFYPGLVQRYSPSKDNSDVRVIVVGGRAVAAMRRVSPNGDFRANIALGGLAQQVELDAIDRRVAEEAALAVGQTLWASTSCGPELKGRLSARSIPTRSSPAWRPPAASIFRDS